MARWAHGIVQVTAQSGYEVAVREVSGQALDKGLTTTTSSRPRTLRQMLAAGGTGASVGPRLL